MWLGGVYKQCAGQQVKLMWLAILSRRCVHLAQGAMHAQDAITGTEG